MPLYESVFIIRQDVSSADLDKITDGFVEIIKNNGGELVKQEYWGIRNLAYEINNNRKGHYVLLGLNALPSAIAEMERKMRLAEEKIARAEANALESVRTKAVQSAIEAAKEIISKEFANTANAKNYIQKSAELITKKIA